MRSPRGGWQDGAIPNHRSRIAIRALVALLCLLFAASCGPRSSHRPIGALLASEGLSKIGGDQARTAIALAQRATGLRVLTGAAGGDAYQATHELRRLIEQEHVQAVVAAISSDDVLACAPIANREHVVLIATIASSEEIRNAGDYVFRTTGSSAGEAKVLAARIFADLARGRIAVVHSARSFGLSYRDSFLSAFVALGGAPPRTYSFPDGTFDFLPIVQGIRAQEPDGIFIAGGVQEIGLLTRQLRAAGVASRLYAAGVISPDTFRVAGGAAEGMIVADNAWDPDSKDPWVRTFVRDFLQIGGAVPDYAGAGTYDAVRLIAEAMQSGATSGEEIRSHLTRTAGFQGIQGRLTFDADGEINLGAALLEVRDGRLHRLPP